MLGIGKLEARLDTQEQATREHRAFEGVALREIQGDLAEVKTLAQATNGRVNAHDVTLAVIAKAEQEARDREAARLRAQEEARSHRLSWRQGVAFASCGALVSGLVLGVLHLAGVA